MHEAALTLDGGPRSVHDARRWTVDTCGALGRDDLAESAELAISELVTNAILHGTPPVRLRVGGTPDHPRFEVYDASPVPPQPPTPASGSEPELDLDAFDEDALDGLSGLASFGRGLALVARSSFAWGAEIEGDGKTVWFEPVAELGEHEAPFRLSRPPATTAPAGDDVTVTVPDVPVDAFARFQQHYQELRREIRLLSLAHRTDFPQAAALSSYFDALEQPLRGAATRAQVHGARAAGATTFTLALRLPAARTREVGGLAPVLDAADEFCRSERLLTLPRTEEQRAFQTWLLGEVERQLRDVPARAEA